MVQTPKKIQLEVAYATPARQEIVRVTVDEGSSLVNAVRLSGICRLFPEIVPEAADLGVFGKVVKNPGEQVARDGDRIEIYRPLLIDPKQARLNRAKTQAKSS